LAAELINEQLSGAADGIPAHVSVATPFARVQVVPIASTTVAGTQMSARLFPGKAVDILTIQVVPNNILRKVNAVDGRYSVFRGQPLTDFVSNSAGGVGNLQAIVDSKSFPSRPIESHMEAYAEYCRCCANAGFLVYGDPPLTYNQWLLRPIYALNLRRDGAHMSEFMSDTARSEVQLQFALAKNADEYQGAYPDNGVATGGLSMICCAFSWSELRVGAGSATTVVGRNS
jgi:hypothetical protein